MAIPTTQQQYVLTNAGENYKLSLETAPVPTLGDSDVLVQGESTRFSGRSFPF